jgi:hypothetical protein
VKTIFKTQFGSHVYGTNVPTSDLDYKSIYLPEPKEIILQRVKQTKKQNTKLDENVKNTPGDIDHEIFSLQEYLNLLCQGQTASLDMLFTPSSFWQGQPSEHWKIIQNNKDKFLHKGMSAFVGYTKAQAAKYGVKGFRVRALKDMIEVLSNFAPYARLEMYTCELEQYVQGREYMSVLMIEGPQNTQVKALEVCNRKIPLHATVGYALDVFQTIYENYGHRAILAEKNEGIDWKALMHAVRVAKEAEELLLTGQISFPRPEKDLLLKIRKAELHYKEVAEIIEQGLVTVSEAQLKSSLPEKPDLAFADELVYNFYLDVVKKNG